MKKINEKNMPPLLSLLLSLPLMVGTIQNAKSDAIRSAPVSYAQFPETLAQVKKIEGLSVIGDLKNANQFYALPPSDGNVTSSGLSSGSANLGYCETVAQLHEDSLKIAEIYTKALAQNDRITAEAEQLENDYNTAHKRAASFKVTISDLESKLSLYDQQIKDDETRLNELYEKQSSCETRAVCRQIKNEIIIVKNDQAALKQTRANAISEHDQAMIQYERVQAQAQTIKEAWQSKLNYLTIASERVNSLSKQNAEIYGIYGSLEGGYATLKYDSLWNEKFNQLIVLNRSLNPTFSFSKIDTENALVHATFKSKDAKSYITTIPAILDYTVSGQSGDGEIKLNAFPETLSANLRMSVAGACMVIDPARYHLQTDSHGVPEFGISVDYQYRSAYNSRAKFMVDEKSFYQKVMHAGSSGFLWWKKSWETVDVTQIDSNVYRFEWELLDPHTDYKPEDRRKMEAQAVNFIISRLVSKYGTVNTTDPNSISLPPIPSSGLSDMANGLFTLCGWNNVYCAAASWLMKGLDEIIGGGQSTASGTRKFEAKGELEWSETILQPVPATTTYISQYSSAGIQIKPAPSPSPNSKSTQQLKNQGGQ